MESDDGLGSYLTKPVCCLFVAVERQWYLFLGRGVPGQ